MPAMRRATLALLCVIAASAQAKDDRYELFLPADYDAKNLRRCGGCGAMVYAWPCVACLVAVKERVPEARPVEDDDEESGRGGEGI